MHWHMFIRMKMSYKKKTSFSGEVSEDNPDFKRTGQGVMLLTKAAALLSIMVISPVSMVPSPFTSVAR